MRARILKAFRIEPGDGHKILWLGMNLALGCLLMIYLRTLTTILFLDAYGAERLPWLFGGQALVFTALSLLHGSLIGRIERIRQTAGILGLVLFALLIGGLSLGVDSVWVIFALCLLLQPLSELVLVEIGILQTASFHAREARRLQPLVNAAGTLGAVLGGLLGAWLPKLMDSGTSLLLSMAVVALMGISSRQVILRHAEPIEPGRGHASEGLLRGLTRGLAVIHENRLMGLFVIVLFACFLGLTLVDFQMKSLLKEAYDKQGMATFLGYFYAALNGLTLLAQLFISSRYLTAFGLVGGLLLMPLILLAGSAAFMLSPMLGVIAGVYFLVTLVSYSVFKDASGLLHLPFSPTQQGRLSITTRGLVRPLGVIAGSGMLLLIGDSAGLHQLSWLVIGFALIAMLASLGIGKPYVEQLNRSLSDRRIRLQPPDDKSHWSGRELRRQIEIRLQQEDTAGVRFALALIREHRIGVTTTRLTDLLAHPDPEVRHEALQSLEMLHARKAGEALFERLHQASDPAEIAALLRLLRRMHAPRLARVAKSRLGDTDWRVRGQALAAASHALRAADRQRLLAGLDALDPLQRAAALLASGELGLDAARDRILRAMNDADPRVRDAAIGAALRIPSPELGEALIHQLHHPAWQADIAEALVRRGKGLIPHLVKAWWLSPSPARRKGIARVLARMPGSPAGLALIELFRTGGDAGGDFALAALGHRRQRFLPGGLERKALERLIRHAVQTADRERHLLGLMHALDDESFREPSRKARLLEEIGLRIARRREQVFSILALLDSPREMRRAWYNYASGKPKLRANSLELLDNCLDARLKAPILELLEGEDALPPEQDTPWSRLARMRPALDPWLKALLDHALRPPRPAEEETGMNPALMTHVERVFALKAAPIFSTLSAEALRPLAEVFDERSVAAGTVLFKQGDASDAFHLIVDGQFSVQRDGREIARLERGASFGEMALLDNEVRSATLVAVTDAELLSLDKNSFQEVLEEYPEVTRAILRVLSRRLRETLAAASGPVPASPAPL